jgi:hypothetical protein
MFNHELADAQAELPAALTPREYIVSVKHGDDAVLLNVETGRYFTLNATGTTIWRWICERLSPRQIVSELQREYGITPDAAREATLGFLRACAAASLFQEDWSC